MQEAARPDGRRQYLLMMRCWRALISAQIFLLLFLISFSLYLTSRWAKERRDVADECAQADFSPRRRVLSRQAHHIAYDYLRTCACRAPRQST